MIDNAVIAWFGPQFARLHPLLQALHRDGGRLHGEIELRLGNGIAEMFGRRMARRLGMPDTAGRHGLQVDIAHDADGLLWSRRFDGGQRLESRFRPVGRWPHGFWRETTGPVTLELGVDVVDGGWYWCDRRMRLWGLTVPAWMAPCSRAGKCIEHGRYRFSVSFRLPLLGEVLAYEGLLDPQSADRA